MLALRLLACAIPIVAVGVAVGVVAGVTSPTFVVAEIAMIGGVLLQDRFGMRLIDRWHPAAHDEPHIRCFHD